MDVNKVVFVVVYLIIAYASENIIVVCKMKKSTLREIIA